MSCSCTGNCDLIDIEPLVLSDTFHTWFDRTNEAIGHLNNINIYDVQVGLTNGGLTTTSSCVNGNYNGLLTIKVAPGPGIGVGTILTPNYYLNHTMIDVVGLTHYGSTGFETNTASSFPSVDDWYIFSDASDGTLGSGNGTPKKIKAQQILPSTVYLPSGFQFNGNVSINGNLSVQGTQSNIDSNQLRIEDKAVEVAYRRFVAVDVTGPTYGGFPSVGATFNYFDAGVGSTANPTTIGTISSVVFDGATTHLKLHNFTVGGVNDIAPLGRISITGAIFDFTMNAGPTTTDEFFSDDLLDEAGLIVKGASGDKAFLWTYKEGPSQVIYNAFVTTTNIGVSGSSNAVIASKFRSYGYSDSTANDTFQFMGYNTGKPKIILGGATGTANSYSEYGYWSVQHDNGGGTSTQQPLVWKFKQYASGTESSRFTIHSGPSGPTYGTITVTGQSNNRVTNFAEGLNVDFLDGAHGTTMPTPWSIPVSLTNGYLDEGWVNPNSFKAITRCFTQASHGLVVGDVVRINPDNGGLTYALATSREYAEVLGVVSSVVGNEVCVVSKGYVFGLTGTASSNIYDILPLVTGNVYFLSPNDAGGMIADPDGGVYPIGLGEVRKPVMMAISSDVGYVVNYLGVVEGDDTDLIEVQGIAPVGQIMPFSGPLSLVPYGWLACDGSRVEKGLWPELYATIGQKYYAVATIDSNYTGTGNVGITLPYSDNLGILAGDLLTVSGTIGATTYSRETKVVSVSGSVITVESFSFGGNPINGLTLKVRGRVGTGGTSIFFLPDFRTRTLIGATEGLDGSFGGISTNLGDIGGVTGFVLQDQNIPQHYHGLNPVQVASGEDYTLGAGYEETDTNFGGDAYFTSNGPAEVSTTTTAPISTVQPYASINWIIRAKKGLSALILSGHNHDDRYHPLNGDMYLTGGSNVQGNWRVKYSSETLSAYPRLSRVDGSDNGVFRTFYDAGNVSHPTNSVGSIIGYGDFSLYTEGITANNGLGGIADNLIFDFNSKTSQMAIFGQVEGFGGGKFVAPKIEFGMYGSFDPHGYISGLTAPTTDDRVSNKWYADTAPKYVYAPISTSSFDGMADGAADNQFVVIAPAGVARSTAKTIMAVGVDNTPTNVGRSKTDVHIRGDIHVFGNGMTGGGLNSSSSMTAHTEPSFAVESLYSRVRILGGGTYPGLSTEQEIWHPVLSFQNREVGLGNPVSSKPIGKIEGLTAPTQTHEAANKWYVDQTVSRTPLALTNGDENLASGKTLTGVAFFNWTDFTVDSEGLVSAKSPTEFVISETYPVPPNVNYPPNTADIAGFNIKTAQGLISTDSRNVITAYVDPTNLAQGSADSVQEVFVNGDFTVWGDGLPAQDAHTEFTFAVDPKRAKLTVQGGVGPRSVSLSEMNPTIDFIDARGGCRGKITGLTAPTDDCEAANKWYVDNSRIGNNYGVLDFVDLQYAASSGASFDIDRRDITISNIQPGVYMINVTVNILGTADTVAEAHSIQVDGVIYRIGTASSDGTTQPFATFSVVKMVTGTSIRVLTVPPVLGVNYQSNLRMVSWAKLGA